MPPAASPALDKARLRAQMRARLRALTADERRERSASLPARLAALDEWRAARCVLLFAPLPTEPDIDLLWADGGLLQGKTCGYPRLHAGGLTIGEVRAPGELRAARRWGLREPSPDAPPPGLPVDFILAPGLAFTFDGSRLGRGGGYYDRLLAQLPTSTHKVGICFDFQIVPTLPEEPHDAAVDRVLAC